jgi:hypothetical protein
MTVNLEVLEERIGNLKETQVINHTQNRKDIHAIKNELETMNNQIWLIKLKIAAYSGGGSALAVGIMEAVKWLFHH